MSAIAAFFLGLLMHVPGGAAVYEAIHPTPEPVVLPTDSSGQPLRIPIFIYHTIKEEDPAHPSKPEDYLIPPSLLDEQLTYLSEEGYTTVTMKEAVDMLKRGTTSPTVKPVVLGFDDGWKTQYQNALPLLKKHHAKATFYIFPNPVSKDDRFMTWEQLEEIRDSGMEIASHSYTHPLLSKQTPEMLHHELHDSKALLEEKLKITVTNFASPFGYTSDVVREELVRDGYESGRTTNAGFTHTKDDLMQIDAYLVHKGMKDFVWAVDHGK